MNAAHRTALTACLSVLAAGSALAQAPSMAPPAAAPAAAAPATAGDAGAVTGSDRRFLVSEARGSAYELAISQLAQERAARQDVKDYAGRMVSDHGSYNTELRRLAGSRRVDLPDGLTRGDKQKLDKLRGLHGAAFDNAFVAEARRINAEDVRDGHTEAQRTKDPAIRSFLERFASVDTEHQKIAEGLRSSRR
jgi:putative membrane protein